MNIFMNTLNIPKSKGIDQAFAGTKKLVLKTIFIKWPFKCILKSYICVALVIYQWSINAVVMYFLPRKIIKIQDETSFKIKD